ncbi:MAG: OmpH family outer membrane protein [Chitinophagales bacterium]|nr:OmpH family outer membrane protein [Chitinophagales bacterium]MDW8428668.1 OmpH family outer membrane protein [Chitinophagales bacterium]
MKALWILWNGALTAALIYLFVQKPPSTSEARPVGATDGPGLLPIAFINIDSLEKHYKLFADKRQQLEKKQQQMEALLERKYTEMQNDYQALQQAAPTMTPSQLEEAQRKLENKQLELQRLQQQLETDLQQHIQDFNRQLEDSLSSFLDFLNAERKYQYILSYTRGGAVLYSDPALDITQQVIEGMNKRLGL